VNQCPNSENAPERLPMVHFRGGKTAESTRARATPRAGGQDAGTTRSSELPPSAVAFSGRPIRPDPWLRAGSAFSPSGKKRFGYGHLVITFQDAPLGTEARIRERDEEQERDARTNTRHQLRTTTFQCVLPTQHAHRRAWPRVLLAGRSILFAALEMEKRRGTFHRGKTPPRRVARTRTPRAFGHDVAAGVGEDNPARRARGRSVTGGVALQNLRFSPSRLKIVIIPGSLFITYASSSTRYFRGMRITSTASLATSPA